MWVTISSSELNPGTLADLFAKGNSVVILKDTRIVELWKKISGVKADGNVRNARNGLRHLRDENIFDIGGHHCLIDEIEALGDMIRFTPDMYSYVARKVKFFPSMDGEGMETFPNSLKNEDGSFIYSEDLLQTIWLVMSEVFDGLVPSRASQPPYAVKVETLIYPKSVKELAGINSLLENSSGKWSKLGHRLDAQKGKAAGFFNQNFIRDCFAIGLMIPKLNGLLNHFNERYCIEQTNEIPKDTLVLGGDHVDGSKILTCLTGDRENIITQIYASGKWIDLPVDANSLAIFPGKQISKIHQLVPTRHRILMTKASGSTETQNNTSLIFAIVER